MARNVKSRKRGVSPVVATTIIIAVTLVVGFAVFAFVNAQSAVASQAMGEDTATYVNYLRERFVITNVAFDYNASIPGASSGKITIWIYNNGNITTQVNQLFIGTLPTSLTPITSFTTSPSSLAKGEGGHIVFDYDPDDDDPIPSGTHYFKVVGKFGNAVLYYQTK